MPQQFGPYTLHELIARGGMAEVYRATMPGIGGFEKPVAIKKILPHLAENNDFITMLIDEARIIVSLNHANIAQVYDLGRLDDTYYIAMEYVHGVDLSRVLKTLARQGRKMPLPHALYITSAVCAGLHIAHNKVDEQGRPLNIVHRDISPHNVLISYAGDVKIIDFGVAKARGKENTTKMGVIKGKLLYMAPEQAMAKGIDGRADLFSAGLVLYSMLTGKLPFDGDNEFQIYNNILSKEIVPPRLLDPQIPDEVNGILMTLLDRDPDRRYQDGYGVKVDLDRALHDIAPGYSVNRLSRFLEENFGESPRGQLQAGGPEEGDSGPRNIAPQTPSFTSTGTDQHQTGASASRDSQEVVPPAWSEIDEMQDTVNLSLDNTDARKMLEKVGGVRAWEDGTDDELRVQTPTPTPAELHSEQDAHHARARDHVTGKVPPVDEAARRRIPLAPLVGITLLVIFIVAMLVFEGASQPAAEPAAEDPAASTDDPPR